MALTSDVLAQVQTLTQAHEFLHKTWPGNAASAAAWLAHHQRAAELYEHVAQVDADHHNEARYWARQEQEQVRAFLEGVTGGGGDGEQ